MSNNSLTPEIRFSGHTDDWELCKFGDMFDLTIPNNTLTRAELNYDFGSIKNIHYGDVLIKYGACIDVKKEIIPFITDGTFDEYKTQLLQNGDVIFADTAEDETTGKATEVINIENEMLVSGMHTIACRPLDKKAEKFLGYYLNSKAFHNQLIPLMQGIKVLSLSRPNLAKTFVAYPTSKEEQSLIGLYFYKLDAIIAYCQQKHKKFIDIKKSMFDKMFPKHGNKIPEIRFCGFSDDWNYPILGAIGKTYTGLSGKTKADFGHGNATFITYMNVYSNPITDPAQVEAVELDATQYEVQEGDIFFTTSSETPEEVGMSSVLLEKNGTTYLNSFCFGYRLNEGVKIDKYYLAYMLRSPAVRERIAFLAQGISRFNISKTKMMEIEIPIPENYEEQEKIGAFFFNLDRLIEIQDNKVAQLKNIKSGLLNKMFPKGDE